MITTEEITKKFINGIEIKLNPDTGNRVWTFPRKGYARIYVEKEDDIALVKEVIEAMDEYEFKHYFHDELIAVFDGRINTVYCHKFCDFDIGILIENCWKLGIKIFAIDNRYGSAIYD